ncbi:MAG: hypothetical protein AAGJ18_27525 [Bacteroidota bacterium]
MWSKIKVFRDIRNSISELNFTNPVKVVSEKIVRWFAKENDDIDNFPKLYSTVTILLLLVMCWSSYNAAQADFSVLFGNHYNIHQNDNNAWWYAFIRAAYIQSLILIPTGVIAKLILHGKFWKKEHRWLFSFLLIVAIFGFHWSYELSMEMKQAARAESQTEVDQKKADLSTTLSTKQLAVTELDQKALQTFLSDSTFIAKAFRRKISLTTADYRRKRDSLVRRAATLYAQYQRDGVKWKIGQTRKINNDALPQLKSNYQYSIRQINSILSDSLLAIRGNIFQDHERKKELAAMEFDGILKGKESDLKTLEKDIEYNATTRTYKSIMYNVISAIILFFGMEVYKRINKAKVINQQEINTKIEQENADLRQEIILLKEHIERTRGNGKKRYQIHR